MQQGIPARRRLIASALVVEASFDTARAKVVGMTRQALVFAGAGAQNRTVDLLITNQLLYP